MGWYSASVVPPYAPYHPLWPTLGARLAAYIYIAEAENLEVALYGYSTLLLESTPEYWFLYRYFEAANLDHQHELIDLYGGGPIDGYQLVRLKAELVNAKIDTEAKPQAWKVLTGWDGEKPSLETEIWEEADKEKVISIIESLNSMIDECNNNGLVLVCSGD